MSGWHGKRKWWKHFSRWKISPTFYKLFLMQKCFSKFSLVTVCVCIILAEGNLQKAAHKMLLKLTTCKNLYLHSVSRIVCTFMHMPLFVRAQAYALVSISPSTFLKILPQFFFISTGEESIQPTKYAIKLCIILIFWVWRPQSLTQTVGRFFLWTSHVQWFFVTIETMHI